MARYQVCDESVQLVEAGQGRSELQVQPKPKQWRRLGVGLIVMCTIGAMAFAHTRQRRATPQERLLKFHRKIIRAFERHLSDEHDFTYDTHLGFSFTDEDSTASPDHMGADLTLEKDGEHDGDLQNYLLLFEPAEGKLDDLEEGLNGILAEIKTMAKQMNVDGAEVDQWISVFKNDERAGFTFTPQVEQDQHNKMYEEMAKETPTINGTIYFGRTLQEMYDAGDESLATVHGGLEVTAHVRLYRSMIEVMMEDEESTNIEMMDETERAAAAEMQPHLKEARESFLDKLASIASIGGHISMKYRKDKLAEVAESMAEENGPSPTIQALMDKIVGSVPPNILEKVAALRHSVDGLHSLSMHGLQDQGGHCQLRMFFHNVHLTPLINNIHSKMKEGAEEDNSQDETTNVA